jgi:hypothetical protein
MLTSLIRQCEVAGLRKQASKLLKRTKEGEWAKSDEQKANALADCFANVFKPYTSEMPEEQEREILRALGTPGRLESQEI